MSHADDLQITTPSDRELRITRSFAAPRKLVWEAFSKPEHLRRWMLGPPGWEMIVCEVDDRAGGTFRHVWRDPSGVEMAMHGVYREVVKPERIVRTETFDTGCAPQSGEQIATFELTEKSGRTTCTITLLFPTKQARDAMLQSGMEHGMRAGYERLDAILATAGAAS